MSNGNTLNGWIYLNKPLGLTSRKILNQCQRLLSVKKAGYVGTLDPLATGVLPLAFGEACKTIYYLEKADKEYRFKVKWGIETATGDLEGEIIKTSPIIPSVDAILKAIPQFVGHISQRPPRYSAIKIDGQRAYDLARKNVEFECEKRDVHIESLQLLSLEGHDSGESEFLVSCSKGTYVRQIAVDLAEVLGTCATVIALHRTRLGKITEDMTISLDFLEKRVHDGESNTFLHPLGVGLDDIPAIFISDEEEKYLRYGQKISLEPNRFNLSVSQSNQLDHCDEDQEPVYLAKCQNRLVGFVVREEDCLKAKRLFNI
ncbi:MAG: tRNA pseudouridine(55) synthase TruB [Alphaproteobacteria bacterium]|jgi:tRNA pseudouridine55 synthase|nr:tRNA pseudouridine(55) synthase TruB [Alphaproteobacteria bacterium]MBP9877410.1 tRNA pseudouridine(55) synthase TruB [Alphaproteobacteria bacterium]